jgi:oxygen-independent coproporphyrinogen-3 oxidase
MYEVACGALRTAGYEHYEVSNWSRRGHESIHNLGYWEGRPYLGVGAGAHSFRGRRRWWNGRPPGRYVELALEGRSTQAGGETLEDEARRLERLLLGMRRATGVPAGWVDRPPMVSSEWSRLVGGLPVRPHRARDADGNEVVLAVAG